MRLVMNISDQVTVLSAGTIIAEGPPHVVQRDPTVIAAYLGNSE
jgi:ABC-type branched-subunit amino acid transport system ATPase component